MEKKWIAFVMAWAGFFAMAFGATKFLTGTGSNSNLITVIITFIAGSVLFFMGLNTLVPNSGRTSYEVDKGNIRNQKEN